MEIALPTLTEIESATQTVHAVVPPTPQYAWPLLAERCGADVWVKHENHTPIGAFKVRGGLLHLQRVLVERPGLTGVISATRGNHGQSIAFAARRLGLAATIVVPKGNSSEKNAAMRAFGAELVETGHDFQAAREAAEALALERNLRMVPSFHRDLIEGVASYPFELFHSVPDLAAVYVPIGLGSGICATIAARDALGLRTEVIGVVAARAPAYRLSFDAGRPVSTNTADTLADGMACRVPEPAAVEIINRGAARIVAVEEEEIAEAMRAYYQDTHNLAEGAGAAGLAALLQERQRMAGRKVAVVLSGGNIDAGPFLRILQSASTREFS